MAFCPSGQHPQKKAGFSDHVIVGTSALGATLNNVPVLAAVPFAALVASIGLDLASLCTADPPAQPTMLLADWVALAGPPGLAEFTGAQAKFTQWCQYFLWFQFCECSGGTTAGVTVPSIPSGIPQINPAIPGYPSSAAPCLTADSGTGFHFTSAGGSTMISQAFGALTPTSMLVTAITSHHTGTGATINVTVDQGYGSPEVPGTQTTMLCPTAGTTTLVVPIDTTAGYYTITGHGVAGSGDSNVQVLTQVFCNGQPALGPVQPCCPPDPLTQGMLDQILQLVTLIQRQAAPFAYIASTVHSGLTGAGSLAIADLIGVRVAITTDSARLGEEGTSPAELFDRGWITFATSDGALHSSRLEHAAQLVLPCQAGIYTTLYYDLNSLITVSITELVREP